MDDYKLDTDITVFSIWKEESERIKNTKPVPFETIVVDDVIGWVTPDGLEFYKCDYGGHNVLAGYLLDDFHAEKQFDISRYICTEKLLELGWTKIDRSDTVD